MVGDKSYASNRRRSTRKKKPSYVEPPDLDVLDGELVEVDKETSAKTTEKPPVKTTKKAGQRKPKAKVAKKRSPDSGTDEEYTLE